MVYRKLILESAKNLKNNPKLIVPDLMLFFSTTIFGIIFLKILNLLPLLQEILVNKNTIKEVLMSFLQNTQNIVNLVILLIIFFIITFFAGASLMAIKFQMMKDITLNKKPSFIKSMKNVPRYLWGVVGLRILIFIISILIVLLIYFFFTMVYYLFSISIIYGILSAIILSAIALFILAVFKISVFFVYQILFFEDKSAMESLALSFLYSKKHSLYIILIWCITFSAGILFWLITIPLNNIIDIIEKNLISTSSAITIFILTMIITAFFRVIINLIYLLWSNLFLFFAYKESDR